MHETIKKIRRELRYTQEDMAKLIGIERSSYSIKENGKGAFLLPQLIKILYLAKDITDEVFYYRWINDIFGFELCRNATQPACTKCAKKDADYKKLEENYARLVGLYESALTIIEKYIKE